MWSPVRFSLERFWTVSIPRTRCKSQTACSPLQFPSSFLPEITCYRALWTSPCILSTTRYADLPNLNKLLYSVTVKIATKFPRRFKTLLTYVWLWNSESAKIMDLVSRCNKVYETRDIAMGSAVMCSTTHKILSAYTQCGKRWMKPITMTIFLFLTSDVHRRGNLSYEWSC